MNESAVILNGKDVVKVTNLKRKYNKLVNNPDIKILEECTKLELEEKYLYWKNQFPAEVEDEDWRPKLYYFYNPTNGHTLTSIYPTVEDMKKNSVVDDGFYNNWIKIDG